MSILDQIFPDLADDPTQNAVQVTDIRGDDWVIGAFALAAHQAMVDGFDPPSSSIDTSIGRINFNLVGTFNVAESLKVSKSYRQLLVQEQLKDVRFRPTADDVVDGGIKNGSKVVIKIVDQNEGPLGSWDRIVRSNIANTDGTPRDLTFDKFSVMSITEPDEQRYQIHETFGADILQTFGRRPRILTISGQVVNGKLDVSVGGEIRSMDWKNAFQRFYENHYSAHACTKKIKKVRIFSQDTVYDGYMLNMVAATTAMDQGISQVTITFLLASRNFPRENDDKIPGFLTNNNFVLSGRSTPDDVFSQAQIEHYFQEDFSNVIDVGITESETEADKLINELSVLISFEAETGKIFDGLVTLDTSDDANNFFSPAEGFRLHELCRDSSLADSVIAYAFDEAEFLSNKGLFNLSFNEDPDAEEIANVGEEEAIAAINVLDYTTLKSTEAYLRAFRAGLIKRVNKANDLALRIEDLEREKRNLQALKRQI